MELEINIENMLHFKKSSSTKWIPPTSYVMAGFTILWVLFNLLWIDRFRAGKPFDIDEAGYISMAFNDVKQLHSSGIIGFGKGVFAYSQVAPLVPTFTALTMLLGWSNPVFALITPLIFGAGTVVVSYILGRKLLGNTLGLLVGIFVACDPVIIDYSRSYQFVTAATFFATASLLFLVLSDGFSNSKYSILFGLSVGAMIISRTMTIAFLPGFALASVCYTFSKTPYSTKFKNIGLALIGFFLTAGIWYARNWQPVWQYLFSFGYGPRAAEYGNKTHLFSISAWKTTFDNIAGFIYLPSALLVLVISTIYCLQAMKRFFKNGAAVLSLKRPFMPTISPLVAFSLSGLFVLTTSQNKGSGFMAPLVPVVLLICAYLCKQYSKKLQVAVLTVALVVSSANLVSASGIISGIAEPAFINIKALGSYTLLDGRGMLQKYVDVETRYLASKPMTNLEASKWRNSITSILNIIRKEGGGGPIAFGFRDRLVNTNSIQLENLKHLGSSEIPLVVITPIVTGNTVSGYQDWLTQGDAQNACLVLTATGNNLFDFVPNIDANNMQAAVNNLKLQSVDVVILPDQRRINFYTRTSSCGVKLIDYLSNVVLGDTFGRLQDQGNGVLFVHPGVHRATSFRIDRRTFPLIDFHGGIKFSGRISPAVPKAQLLAGGGVVRFIVKKDGKAILNKVVDIRHPVELSLTLSKSDFLDFSVDDYGNPNSDWFLLTFG